MNQPVTVKSSGKKSTKSSVELFTGAGGLALATHMAGFHHTGLFEWNPEACATLRSNAKACTVKGLSKWRDRVTEGDVAATPFSLHEGIDLVAGGPPCQPFSMGGKAQGMEDGRDMIPQFIRAVRETKPKAFIMENVRGLTRPAFANYLSYTILQLTYPENVRKPRETWMDHFHRLQKLHTGSGKKKGLTYSVVPEVLNAANFGVPQCRERIFIVGFRQDLDANWSFPIATHSQLSLLHDQWVTGKYWERFNVTRPPMPPFVARRIEGLKRMRRPKLHAWKTIREAIDDLPEPFTKKDNDGNVFNHRIQHGARPYPGHTGSPYDSPSKTLKAGDHGVPGGENMIAFDDGTCRYLTVREAARIQTFPDSWHFEGPWTEAMRQLGNAVPVNLAKVVAKSVAETLDKV